MVRAIRSYSQNFGKVDRCPKIVVSDDSDSLELQNENTSALKHLAEVIGHDIYYLNEISREQMSATLSRRSGVPPEIVRFACCNSGRQLHRYGSNRNSLLLCTAGSLILSVDDDTVCRPAEVVFRSIPENRVILSGDVDITFVVLFSDQAHLRAAVSETEQNVLACHEALLGQPLTSYLQRIRSGTAMDMENMCSHVADAMRHGKGRIGITFNGQWGRLGVDNLLQLRMTRKTSVQSEPGQTMERTQLMPWGLRFSPTPAICHGGFCMTTFIGIDNRSLLPPFPPCFRNEDGVFGTLLSACSPSTFLGHIPVCLLHDPLDQRTSGAANFSVRFSDVIISLVTSLPKFTARDGIEQNPQALGHHLYAVGSSERRHIGITLEMLYGSSFKPFLNSMRASFHETRLAGEARVARNSLNNYGRSWLPIILPASSRKRMLAV